MSYLVVTCRNCAGRKIISLKGRSIPFASKCPYCGARIIIKESPFKLFDDYASARAYTLKAARGQTTLDL